MNGIMDLSQFKSVELFETQCSYTNAQCKQASNNIDIIIIKR